MEQAKRKKPLTRLPVLPLRGTMVFPHMVLHFDVGRAKSVSALEKAMLEDQRIFLVAQRDADVDSPALDDLYPVGTIAKVKQVLNLPGDSLRVLVAGEKRAKLKTLVQDEPFLLAELTVVSNRRPKNTDEMQALVRTTHAIFEEYSTQSMRVSQETLQNVMTIQRPDQLADVIAANALTQFSARQELLEITNVQKRLERLCTILLRETELSELEKNIQARIKLQIEKNQKDFYLREQIKAIQTELGDKDQTDVEELRERLQKTPMNEEARQKAERELDRLSHMMPGTPEVSISRTYVEWILDIPWGATTEDNLNLKHARKLLNRDHYGLEDVKDRIIEYLAVLRMKKDMKGPILCFVGPPGIGKTSIVRAVAEAVGRKFVQMSLGGVRDEAEIRGHRRTYVGAIPGRIIAGLKQAGSMNPVFLFDEIDKMSSDFRGNPAAAMLEVLDGEQNDAFRDHYMELPVDLSRVMFITTANTIDSIPPALLDRLEIIEVPSYTELEKSKIASKHLLPKQSKEHGLNAGSVTMSNSVILKLIDGYTREAGVRTLERQIARIVRKATVEILNTSVKSVNITQAKLKEYLGAPRFTREDLETENLVGIVNGLAVTSFGGETLAVECSIMQGNGSLQLTGKLGDVMQESAKAALSWVRTHAETWGIPENYFKEHDIHFHVPEGAVPKDGPSAGIAMTTALTSAILSIPVRQDVAMTGEITLRGRVLPIGGLKEKLLAASRARLKEVLIPKGNMKDLENVPDSVLKKVHVVQVEHMAEVLPYALTAVPVDKPMLTEFTALSAQLPKGEHVSYPRA